MTEQQQTTEVWNPFVRPQRRTFTLESSGGKATATFAGWTAAERIAYEDASSTTLMTRDADGGRTVRFGRMNALLVTSTLRSWTGFPVEVTREATQEERQRALDKGLVPPDLITEGTDLRRLEHLELLPTEVYTELVKWAGEVQPLPGQEAAHAKRAAERAAAEAAEQDGTQAGTDEDGGADAPDPSPTPLTPPADAGGATSAKATPPASPSASSTRPKRSRAAAR